MELDILHQILNKLTGLEQGQSETNQRLCNLEDDVSVIKTEQVVMKVQMDEMKVQLDEMKIQLDEVKVQQDEMKTQLDEVKVQQDEMKIQLDEVKVQLGEVKVQQDEMKTQQIVDSDSIDIIIAEVYKINTRMKVHIQEKKQVYR